MLWHIPFHVAVPAPLRVLVISFRYPHMESFSLEIILLCLGASFIQRTTGFGFGIFIMTMLPYFTATYGEATTLSGLWAMTTSLMVTLRMRRYLSWNRMWLILCTFVVVSTVAVFALKRIDNALLNRILGVVLILCSLYFAFFSRRIQLKPTRSTQLGAGTLSGLMGGFFAMQGPPAVLYFIASEKDKEHYMAMVQCYFLLGNLAMTVSRACNGFLTPAVGLDYLYGLVGVLAGSSLGAFVFRRIPGRLFRYVVYAYIGISGVIILMK